MLGALEAWGKGGAGGHPQLSLRRGKGIPGRGNYPGKGLEAVDRGYVEVKQKDRTGL